jgi:hypothetical protein
MPDWRAVARSIAQREGVDPDLFERQIDQESGFNPNARSGAGALGIAQIVPQYHPGVDPMDPIPALTYAAKWMRELKQQHGSWRDALIVYNGGGRALERWKAGRPFEESVAYINAILGPGKAEAAELDTAPPGRSAPVASPAQDTFDRVVAAKGNPVSVLDVTPSKKINEEDDGTKVFRYVFADGTNIETVSHPGGDFEIKSGTALRTPAAAADKKPSPADKLEPIKDPNTGKTVKLRDPSTGTVIDLPDAKDPIKSKPTLVGVNGKRYLYDPETDTTTPSSLPADEVKPKRSTHTVGKRIYTVDEDGNVVGSADLRTANDVAKEGQDLESGALGIEKDKIAIQKDRQALLPKAQQVIAGHLQTVEYVRGMLERGEIDQAKADAYVAASKAQAEAELGGTTTWAMKKAEDDAKQARERMGVDLLNQRISSESSLGSSVVSSALGLAAKAMLRPGQTSLGVDPFAAAAGYSAQINRGAQTDPVIAALLGGASAAPVAAPGPGLPPGAPAFPPPTGGAGGPSMPGALR